MAVRGCRTVTKRDMKLNDALPRIHVDAETYVVTADGEAAARQAGRRAAAGAAVFSVLRPMSDWLAWQVVDSAFPTGAFAHSWGLEAAWQQGEVEDVAALRRFLDASISRPATRRCRW